MQINEYGQLPRVDLINALGALRTTTMHKSIVPSLDVCNNCSHRNDPQYDCPNKCPHLSDGIATISKTEYVYESRKASADTALSLIGIKTLLLLHMLTQTGGLNDFDTTEAAEYLHCCSLSVKNALTQLEHKGYILFQAGYCPGLYTVILKNYTKKKLLPVDQGGSGYITINKNLMDSIASCKTITSARLLLRTYDFTFANSRHSGGIILYTAELLKSLPAYVSRSKLLDALSTLKNVLQFDTLRHRIKIQFYATVSAESALRKRRADSAQDVHSCINQYNSLVNTFADIAALKDASSARKQKKYAATIKDLTARIRSFGLKRMDPEDLRSFSATEKEINDFTNIAVKYGGQAFRTAFIKACDESIDFTDNTGSGSIRSRGAFLHSLVKDILFQANMPPSTIS